jgi:hypothetical protein
MAIEAISLSRLSRLARKMLTSDGSKNVPASRRMCSMASSRVSALRYGLSECVEMVYEREYPRAERDLLALKPVGVAAAVPPLVVGANVGGDGEIELHVR